MTYISRLNLSHVRSHNLIDFKFDKFMNAIVGPNGSGKTTVIESLYTLLLGTSFKGSIKEMVQNGQNTFSANLEIKTDNTNHNRSLKYLQTEETSQKKWSIDNKKYARLPLSARLPVVLFEPDLARLITGSPNRRRSYLDSIAGQLDIETAKAQIRFDRVLKQRNQLLKHLRRSNESLSDHLFVWDTQMAHESEKIIKARIKVLSILQKDISKYYKKLGGSDDISITYKSQTSVDPATYATFLLKQLELNIYRDLQLGFTSVGPHRDDLAVEINSQPADERASRGEVRTIVIALKLLETAIMSNHSAQYDMSPTLLLDDVLSELDLNHQEKVLDGLKDHQVFITTTDAHALTPGVHTIFLE